ncbi:putative polysialic acid transport protein [Crocosphaera subtropica ATCC 51142]|uniref:Polysialic acid transport protein n=1 Tax=Crocosphaera subtropica (strain ATCC 51142 / BH68) TaxID=43989 RepID=B1WYU2_CROS5|nr:ABC transporter permease [Crocosphaera subtropica]ACB51109.1 putative polysialic acid transport protein [Crocosphaera subtropica ATCC 51142]
MSQANRQPTRDKHKKPLPVVVYEPNSRVRHPIQLLQEMWYDLLASRELAWQLLQRDIQSQYRQSLLGALWIFIPPLVTAVGLTFLREARVLNLGETPIPYPVFVALSMTLWQTFIQTFNNTMGAARTAKSMLMKLNVPPEAFVISKIAQTLFNFLIQLIPIFFLFVWFRVGVTWTILIAPVAFIHLILFGAGMGLILSPFSCLYGDVNRAIGFVTRLWLFVTPVIYPQPREGFWAILVKINPVTPLLATTRDLATTGDISNVTGFWIASVVAIIMTLFGWIFYRLSLPFLVERA